MDSGKKNGFSDVKLCNREFLEISGVEEIISYDDKTVVLTVNGARTVIEGENIRITALTLEDGRVCACGRFCAVIFEDSTVQVGGIFSRLFKGRSL